MNQMRKRTRSGRNTVAILLISILIVILSGCSGMGRDGKRVAVPMGTSFMVTLSEPLSTASNEAGETFFATSKQDLTIGDTVAIPAGSQVRGMLSLVEQPGRTKGRARMTLIFNGVMLDDGTWYSIASRPISLEAPSQTESDIEKVAAGGVAGAVVGAIAGGRKGAAIGGILGASTGGAVVLATKGDEIVLPRGQQFEVELKGPVSLPIASIQ